MHKFPAGATSRSIYVWLQDSSSALGAGLTGLTYATSGLAASYARLGQAAVDLPLVAQTVAGAWTAGGFAEIDAVKHPGRYRLDLPDAALAVGVAAVALQLRGVANLVHEPIDIRLTQTDDQNATTGGISNVSSIPGIVTVTNGTATQVTGIVNNGVTLAASERVYHAVIDANLDNANTRDEYTVRFFKDMLRQTSGITSPTIQIIKRADGTDLVAETALTQIGSTGAYKYDATGASRLTKGEAVLVVVRATIDAATRTFERIVSRDA